MRTGGFKTKLFGMVLLGAAFLGMQPALARQPDPAVVKQQDQVTQKTIDQVRNVLPKSALAKDKLADVGGVLFLPQGHQGVSRQQQACGCQLRLLPQQF